MTRRAARTAARPAGQDTWSWTRPGGRPELSTVSLPDRDRCRTRHRRGEVVIAAAAADGDRGVAGEEGVFGTDDPARVVAGAAANRDGDVADAGADDAEAVVAVAEVDGQLPDTGHREPGVDGAVEPKSTAT